MKESIYTIPITEAYEQTDACPLCVLRNQFETDALEYLSGGAMMDSDVRLETNRLGFCAAHLSALAAGPNRLATALILESHLIAVLESLQDGIPEKRSRFSGGRNGDDYTTRLSKFAGSCYVCHRLEKRDAQVVSNTVHRWKTDRDFRAVFESRNDYCLPHTAAMLKSAHDTLGGQYPGFAKTLTALFGAKLEGLLGDIQGFTASFDYRRAGQAPTAAERAAIAATAPILTGFSQTAGEKQHP